MARVSTRTVTASLAIFCLILTVGFSGLLPVSPVTDDTGSAYYGTSELDEVRIDSVYGARFVHVGTEQNYRVRIGPKALWPINYKWILDDSVEMIGNNIVQIFDKPGVYTLQVFVTNRVNRATASIQVVVTDPSEIQRQADLLARLAEPPPVAESEAREPDTQPRVAETLPEGAYYSWAVESNFNRSAAEKTLEEVAALGLRHVRIYRDNNNSGTVVYRVLVGQYSSSRSALNAKMQIAEKTGRTAILKLIES